MKTDSTGSLIIVGADNQGSVGPLIAHHPVLEEHDWLCSAVQAEADDPKALPKVVMTLPVLRKYLETLFFFCFSYGSVQDQH